MLAFGGFPGPSIDDSTHSAFVAASTTARPMPELILDPPPAPALEGGAGATSGSSAATQEAARGLIAPAGEAGTLTPLAPLDPGAPSSVPPLGSDVPPAVPPAPPPDGIMPTLPEDDPAAPPPPAPLPDPTLPTLPEGADSGEATDAIASSTAELEPVTDEVDDLP